VITDLKTELNEYNSWSILDKGSGAC